MKYFIDFASGSLIKHGEELCGDNVEFYIGKDMCVAVLSDGLSSGVKANILSTLTSTIALTMIKNGLTIEETVETIDERAGDKRGYTGVVCLRQIQREGGTV